jgi:hypothetical protein
MARRNPPLSLFEAAVIQPKHAEVIIGPRKARVEAERFEKLFPPLCPLASLHEHYAEIQVWWTEVGPEREHLSQMPLGLVQVIDL